MTHAPESPELVALRELHRIVLLVNTEEDLPDVLRTAAQGVVDVLGFQAVVVNLVTSRGDFEAVTVLGPPHDALIGARSTRESFLEELALADVWGRLRFVPEGRRTSELDPATTWTTSEPAAEGPDAWQREDALYAPLHSTDGELLGILSVDLPHDGQRPGPVRREVLEMYAVQIGLAISHARERERLGERLRLGAATRKILQTAAECERLDEILESSVAPLQEAYGGDRTWIRLFADAGGAWPAVNYPAGLPTDLDAAAERGVPSSLSRLDTRRVLASGERVAWECWRAQHTLVVSAPGPDSSAEHLTPSGRQRVLEWLTALGHEQFVLIPLGVGDQCLGYVALNRVDAADWTHAEEQAALDVGRELGRVIGTSRLRARETELIARLEELDDYKSKVVTTIIHELKNPLAVVMGNLELAREEPDLADRAHTAIERGAGRMQALVDDLLALTRLREPAPDAVLTSVDLSAVLHEVASLVEERVSSAGITLDLSGVTPGVSVLGERDELDRLALNLVSNAIKYNVPGGTVSVTLTPHTDAVVLVVSDSGIGIASDDMATIFGEFDRSSNPEARAKPGSGLGLSIVRRIVRRHAGTIEVVSRLGLGSRFIVTLPA